MRIKIRVKFYLICSLDFFVTVFMFSFISNTWNQFHRNEMVLDYFDAEIV